MRHTSIFISLLFLLSCSKKFDNPQVPYYQFTNTSKEWFTDLKQNDTLKFISNLGRTRTYVVSNLAQTKEEYADYHWNFVGAKTLYFYFDQRTISFQRIDSFSKITTIKIQAFVPDTTDPRKPVPSDKGVVKAFLQFDDYIGKPVGAFANLLTDFISPISFINFTIGSRTFIDVIEFSCGCSTPFYDTGWNRWNTINKVRYSKTKGFVNFEMTTGETWNRQF